MPSLPRSLRRRVLPIATVATVALGMLAGAPSAVACSCVGPQPMAAYAAEPRTSVITGIPGALGERGVPVRVTRWIKGPGANAVIWLSGASFGLQSAACQRTPPTVGQELILVLWMPEDGTDPHGGICTPMAALASPEGQAMFEDAITTFGPAGPASSPSPSSNAGASPAGPAPTPEPAANSGGLPDDLADLAPPVGLVAGLALLAAVVALISRRRRRARRA